MEKMERYLMTQAVRLNTRSHARGVYRVGTSLWRIYRIAGGTEPN